MEFRILGPLEVLVEGHRLALGGDKQRALLALLVIHANRTLGGERLIDELWGERPPATAAKALQVHISRLRKALEPEAGSDGAIVTRTYPPDAPTSSARRPQRHTARSYSAAQTRRT